MKTPDVTSPSGKPRLIAFAVAGALMLVMAGVGIYGLVTGPRTTDTTTPATHAPTITRSTPTGSPSPPAASTLPTVAASSDPVVFARNVATALFTWDTATGLMPLDYSSVILEVGDPSGEEQAGLASDVATYLPSREAWVQLRQYATAQTITVEHAYVPDAWDDALEQAQPGQLADGTIAVTVEGTRHRTGVWNDAPVTSDHDVAFTVFVVCAPSHDTCHLLRLSELDNPLR